MKKRLIGMLLVICMLFTMLPVKISAGTWPFVPSDKNQTNGKIHSGWIYIYSNDNGRFAVNGSGLVSPSRKDVTPFYAEHLGNNKYYFYAPNGGYLAVEGEEKDMAGIVVSAKAYVWRIYAYNDGGVRKYGIVSDKNSDYVMNAWGKCTEQVNSHLGLHYAPSQLTPSSYFTVGNYVVEQHIPQWYKDYKNGASAPTVEVEKQVESTVPAQLADTSKEEWDILRYTNIERANAGLPLLVTFDGMQKMTSVRRDELIQKYSHTRPNGLDPSSVFAEYGFTVSSGAENIAKGRATASYIVEGWMDSTGHRKNILAKKLRYMGTGYTNAGECYWIQLFANSSGSDCVSITFDEKLGYFTLKLKNGITAYAPYDPISSPKVNGTITFNYPGAVLGSSSGEKETATISNGWYNLGAMNNYLNINSKGGAELRNRSVNETYYVEMKDKGQVTLKMANGKYLGIKGKMKDGIQLKAVKEPYLWNIYSENNSDIFSLRPATNTKMVVNAAGEKSTDGTWIILWTYDNLDAPYNAEIRFIPAKEPAGAVK